MRAAFLTLSSCLSHFTSLFTLASRALLLRLLRCDQSSPTPTASPNTLTIGSGFGGAGMVFGLKAQISLLVRSAAVFLAALERELREAFISSWDMTDFMCTFVISSFCINAGMTVFLR